MQRKNNLLRKSHRNGIAMIMALAVIVILATIMALSLSLTTQTTKRTTDLYVYEQAILLSKSAAEYALLRISQSAPCTDLDLDFNVSSPLNYYHINITTKYIYTNASTLCSGTGNSDDYFDISTPEQSGSVLMDITVSVDDDTITSEPIRYFRRSIQKL